jgi:hypothetical protein
MPSVSRQNRSSRNSRPAAVPPGRFDKPGQPGFVQHLAIRHHALRETVGIQQQPVARIERYLDLRKRDVGEQADRHAAFADELHLARSAHQERMRMPSLHHLDHARGQVCHRIDHREIFLDPAIDHQSRIQDAGHLCGVSQPERLGRMALQTDVLIKMNRAEVPAEPGSHHGRGDTVTRHIDAVEADVPRSRRKHPHQVAADMPARLQKQTDMRGIVPRIQMRDQRFLDLLGLHQVLVDAVEGSAQLPQRVRDDAVLFLHFPLHADDPVPGGDTGPQFGRIDRFRQEIVRTRIQAFGDVVLFALRGQQNEIDVSILRPHPECTAELQT